MAPRALIALLALVLAAAISYSSVSAASGILDLGSPTNDVPPFLPLGGFHRVGQPARAGSRAQVLFIGTQSDIFSAIERWPMVKALEQFGTLSGVKALTPPCPIVNTSGPCFTAYPTYDWSRAHYVSRYVDFVHKDVVNLQGRPFQRLTHQEAALLRRYGPRPYKPGKVQVVNMNPCSPATMRSYPVVLIGGYVETISNVVICADYSTEAPSAGGLPPPMCHCHSRRFAAVSPVTSSPSGSPPGRMSTPRQTSSVPSSATPTTCSPRRCAPARVSRASSSM